jgi:hypothetical protein
MSAATNANICFKIKKIVFKSLIWLLIFFAATRTLNQANTSETIVNPNKHKSICDYRKKQQVQVFEYRIKNLISSFISSLYSSYFFVFDLVLWILKIVFKAQAGWF